MIPASDPKQQDKSGTEIGNRNPGTPWEQKSGTEIGNRNAGTPRGRIRERNLVTGQILKNPWGQKSGTELTIHNGYQGRTSGGPPDCFPKKCKGRRKLILHKSGCLKQTRFELLLHSIRNYWGKQSGFLRAPCPTLQDTTACRRQCRPPRICIHYNKRLQGSNKQK